MTESDTEPDRAEAIARLTAPGFARLAQHYADEAAVALRSARAMTQRLAAVDTEGDEPALVFRPSDHD